LPASPLARHAACPPLARRLPAVGGSFWRAGPIPHFCTLRFTSALSAFIRRLPASLFGGQADYVLHFFSPPHPHACPPRRLAGHPDRAQRVEGSIKNTSGEAGSHNSVLCPLTFALPCLLPHALHPNNTPATKKTAKSQKNNLNIASHREKITAPDKKDM